MKKRKIILLTSIIVGILVLLVLIFSLGNILKKTVFQMEQEAVTEINDAEQYAGRSAFFEVKNEDYKGYLLGFPDQVTKGMKIEKYYYYQNTFAFDNIYKILLVYQMDEDTYEQEKERISAINMEYQGEKHVPIYTEQGFSYPAYVMSYTEDGVYEYVLMDHEDQRIICVYSQLGQWKEEETAREYLPEDFSLPQEYEEGYNMYYFIDEAGNEVLPELNGEDVKSIKIRW